VPFCPQCGIDNPAAARYCDQCGAMLVPVAGPSSAPPTIPGQPVVVPPAAPAAAPPATASLLVAGPVICPQCGAAAIPGEAFCDNCGAPLSAPTRSAAAVPVPPYSAGLPPQPSYPPPQSASVAPQPPTTTTTPGSHPLPHPIPAPPPIQPPALPPKHLPPLPDLPGPPATKPIPPTPQRVALAPSQLIVAANGAAIALPNSAQAIIGRADPVSKFYPDVDLTPYGALDHGVGRRHLRLFVQGGQIMAEDLDTTNGTLLNGQKLVAKQPQPLRTGDQLQLGKLLFRFQL
jgi:Double zinc ribbon/FHA domain